MKSNSFTVSPERRPLMQRITPLGWFLIVFAVGIAALLIYATVSRFGATTAAPVASLTPTTMATARPTATPEIAATPVETETSAFPATWAAGMYQDAKGQWWPAEDVREQVQKMVEEQYREWAQINDPDVYLPNEVYLKVSDEEARRLMTGKKLDDWFWAKKEFMDTSRFGEMTGKVAERIITVQGFSQDGMTCIVGDTYQKIYLLKYNPETQQWDRIEIPEDGIYNGTQYMGVAVYEMQYDPGDGRWKVSKLVKWIPRP